MELKIQDSELVRRVKNNNCSESLQKLFLRYLPMVDGMISCYYIRSFDYDDWHQEALIVCHETCFRYSGEQGSKFGNFYKMRLSNHFKSLLRRELAMKRRIDKEAGSYEKAVISEAFKAKFVGSRQATTITNEPIDINEFCAELNFLEFEVFEMLLGIKTSEEIYEATNATKQQIQLAKSRCKKKLIKFIKKA